MGNNTGGGSQVRFTIPFAKRLDNINSFTISNLTTIIRANGSNWYHTGTSTSRNWSGYPIDWAYIDKVTNTISIEFKDGAVETGTPNNVPLNVDLNALSITLN